MTLERWIAAALVLLAYAALCAAIVRRERRHRQVAQEQAAALLPAAEGELPVLVAYASQTGQAEEIAWQTARALHTAGRAARLLPLAQVDADMLAASGCALLVASTYGEGDAPDAAAPFERRVMGAAEAPRLAGLHVGVLALGDRTYANFCGFGRRLDAWLAEQGARPLFERIEVDRGDAKAQDDWRRQVAHLAGTHDLTWDEQPYLPWRLAERRRMNPGSAGEPIFHLELEPPAALPEPAWEAGDLVQLRAPAEPDHPREYSIASVPADGRVHLLVRLHRREDGCAGLASGWLCEGAAPGQGVELRLRRHAAFRIAGNAVRPLLLVGNGTGFAGLRAHLRQRERNGGPPCWLVFGERNAATDGWCSEDIDAWLAQGTLERADCVFSRDTPHRRYVQHLLREQAERLREWVARGAAIYVCGSLQGMAAGVDEALAEVLGAPAVVALAEQGRYRRDVY